MISEAQAPLKAIGKEALKRSLGLGPQPGSWYGVRGLLQFSMVIVNVIGSCSEMTDPTVWIVFLLF